MTAEDHEHQDVIEALPTLGGASKEKKPSIVQQAILQLVKIRDFPFTLVSEHQKKATIVLKLLLFLLYNLYFGWCVFKAAKELDTINDWQWCDGIGFLIILTGFVYLGLFYYMIFIPLLSPGLQKGLSPIQNAISGLMKAKPTLATIISGLFGLLALAAVITFLIVDAKDEPERLISALGVLAFVAIGFICSAHPAHIRWRHVFWGIGIEFAFGLIVLRWEIGKNVFDCIGQKVSTFLGFADEGSAFVYGYVVSGRPLNVANINDTANPENNPLFRAFGEILNSGSVFNPIFMFKTLSVIYFFSFCVSMLFYWGTLQWIVMKMGWLLSITVGTTAAESLNAAANIFLGQTEAPLLIKPFLSLMTKSEIHAVMTGGFATIAGTVLAAYISFGIDAGQLIAASVMAAPAALAVSKLFYPETEVSRTTINDIKMEKGPEANVLDAAAQGASTAVMLVLNIAASLIAFLSFVAFLNAIIGWLGILAGVEDLSFEVILGKVFIPIAFLMGVPADDTEKVATLVGIKTVVNEFAAYQKLGTMVDEKSISPRAAAIATYALCGFANPGSIGIQLGGLGAIAPDRKTDLAQVVGRAFVAGCFTSFLNACVAGALISTKSI